MIFDLTRSLFYSTTASWLPSVADNTTHVLLCSPGRVEIKPKSRHVIMQEDIMYMYMYMYVVMHIQASYMYM